MGAMAMKGYSTFPRAFKILEPHYQIVLELTHGRHARFGRLARTYLYQLCVDTGYCLEDLSRATDNRDR